MAATGLPGRRQRGFSRFELAIVAIVFGALATLLLHRFAYYQEAAEKARMEYVIVSLKSALRARLASLMIEGRLQQASQLALQNPFDWLEAPPDNYAGQWPEAASERKPASWYFDSVSRQLFYVVKTGRLLAVGEQEGKLIRLQVVPLATLPPAFDGRPHSTDIVALRLLTPYHWNAGE